MKDQLPRLEFALEAGPWWGMHAGKWPWRGGPSATASPQDSHHSAWLELEQTSLCDQWLAGWLGFDGPNAQKTDTLQRKIEQESDTCPEIMGQTRDFSRLHEVAISGALCREGEEAGLEECCVPSLCACGCTSRLHAHTPCVPICSTQHVLHWHMHL